MICHGYPGLHMTEMGKIEKTINNVVTILENDPLLKGKIVTDDFASCGLILGESSVGAQREKRRWKDEDDAGYYNYMELFYGITGREKLDNALLIVSSQNRINDVKEYLKSLKWDGTETSGHASEVIWAPKITDTQEQLSGNPCARRWRVQSRAV